MKKSTVLLGSILVIFMIASQGVASDLFLKNINEQCGASYDCSICHTDTEGGGELNKNGANYIKQNYDPCTFCADACKERAVEKSARTH